MTKSAKYVVPTSKSKYYWYLSLVDTHISALYCNHNLHIYSVIFFCRWICIDQLLFYFIKEYEISKNNCIKMVVKSFHRYLTSIFAHIWSHFCQSDIHWQNKIPIVIANLELPVLTAHVFSDWHKWVYNNLPVPITSYTQCTPNYILIRISWFSTINWRH